MTINEAMLKAFNDRGLFRLIKNKSKYEAKKLFKKNPELLSDHRKRLLLREAGLVLKQTEIWAIPK
jgi:hypothetical protein